MTKQKKQTRFWHAYKSVIVAALASAGVFNMASTVLAVGVEAGTEIRNTATATYEDDDATEYNTTSNEVVIVVDEVKGLTAVARPEAEDPNGGDVEPGDTISFVFDVTNTGNSQTDVFVPGINNIDFNNFVPAATNPVQVFDSTDTLIGNIDPDGGTLTDAAGDPVLLDPDESFIVRVTGTPDPAALNTDIISVTLGNTDDNTTDEGADQTQNQSDDDDDIGTTPPGANADDLRTVDSTPSDATDNPRNGEREAEATADEVLVASPLAFASILKTSGTVDRNVPSNPNDDVISYSLDLQVGDTDLTGGDFQPADLEGTLLNLDGGTDNVTRILVSDAIPVGTRLASVDSVPTGWTAVVATGAAAAAVGSDALGLNWQTFNASTTVLADVNRIGFITNNDADVVAQGTSVNDFEFSVVTSNVDATDTNGLTIENIAQVFGESVGDNDDQIIYDESGDDNPNNFNDNDTPPVAAGSDYDPATGDDGIAPESDADNDGFSDTPGEIDSNNDNTGTGPNGETNVVLLNISVDALVTGPNAASDATGPSGTDEDDFTNKSTAVPAGLDPATALPTALTVNFDNSLQNTGTDFIANVVIEPISPAQAETASGLAVGTYNSSAPDLTTAAAGDRTTIAIPTGTTVTISEDGGANPAEYTFDGTNFNLTSGTPLTFAQVDPGTANAVDYDVVVVVPTGSLVQASELSIPLVAFPDTGTAGFADEDPTTVVNNITIDRVYTGYIELGKDYQITSAGGTDGDIRTFGSGVDAEAAPTDTIEYRISYQNISRPAGSGSGSVVLNANNFVITEDGAAGDNNWASTTAHVAGSASDTNNGANNGVITYFETSSSTGQTTEPATVEKYQDTVTVLAPGESGTFDFDRTVNNPDPTP